MPLKRATEPPLSTTLTLLKPLLEFGHPLVKQLKSIKLHVRLMTVDVTDSISLYVQLL